MAKEAEGGEEEFPAPGAEEGAGLEVLVNDGLVADTCRKENVKAVKFQKREEGKDF